MGYGLSAGYNNTPVPLDEIISGEPMESHATSLGTFASARELIALDGITYDDGFYAWQWTFAALLPSDIQTLETDILDGMRSGPVSVETRDRYGAFVTLNAIMTLPRTLPLVGLKFGGVVITFSEGELV